MVSSAPNSPGGAAAAAARSRQDTGASLLQELEALSQALYKASQAQNVVGGVPGPSPRKDRQAPPPGGISGLLQKRETMPARPMNDVFSKSSMVGGNRRAQQVRHSMSTVKSTLPLYGEEEQEEVWKQPLRQGRHSMVAASTVAHANVYGQDDDAEAAVPQQPPFGRKLQPWHSQGFEKNLPEVTNFPEWLEDNINFSRKLEAPAEKKKSIWNWKPFRTLSHIGHTRYNCLFTVHVHAIEGLPQAMNGLRLTVHWRHKDRAVQTMPSRVFQGSAEFEETLQLRCSVYGSKNAQHNAVKFMPKAFTLCVIALDVDELTLGQHRLDLSRLLPEAPDHELPEGDEKPLTWTTSFKLTGKAKGGTLVVTFGYELLHKDKGDKSGRFGSVNGSPSPSMSSPSLRSFSGGSHSTHGTPRPRPLADGNSFLSPTLSEPGDYHDYLGMEHLNLDESSLTSADGSSSAGSFGGENSRRGSSTRVYLSPWGGGLEQQKAKGFPYGESKLKQGLGVLQHPETTHLASRRGMEDPAEHKRQQTTVDRATAALDAAAYGDSDEDQDFIVVDQGVEVGTLPENIHYPGHIRSEEEEEQERAHNFEDVGSRRATTQEAASPTGLVQHTEEKVSFVRPPVQKVATAAAADEKGKVAEIVDVTLLPVNEEQGEQQQDEEEDPYEDAVENVSNKPWDPLGRFQSCRPEKQHQRAEGVQDAKQPVVQVGRDDQEEDDQFEEAASSARPKLSNPLRNSRQEVEIRSKHDDSVRETEELWESPLPPAERREEAVQDTVHWDWGTPSLPHPSGQEEEPGEAGLMQKEEISERSSANETVQSSSTDNIYNHPVDDLDDEVDLIAGDFLSMLEGGETGGLKMGVSSDSEVDSPRAVLLRQFEQEALLEGGIGLRLGIPEIPELNLDEMTEGRVVPHVVDQSGRLSASDNSDGLGPGWQSEEDTELTSIMEAAESELQKATQTMRSKTRAKMLEDAETEALMQEWGLNERAFENSPPKAAQGFLDSMGNQMLKVPMEPPILAQGVGPVVQTKDGGMLRSMTPTLFSQRNANGKLVMQVSKPVVVPSEMGSSGLDIFRRLASSGGESMALQAMVAMPLEDITGRSVHQLAYESKAALEGPSFAQSYLPTNGYNTALSVKDTGRHRIHNSALASKPKSRGIARSSPSADPSDEFVSLEELAPLAMQKIEALAIDGLKIQADMTDESAPYCVDSLPWADVGTLESFKFRNGGGIASLDGVAAMQLLDARTFREDVPAESDGLLSKVISIDEWMRLDAGQYDESNTKDDTLAVLAAHGAVHKDLITRGSKEDRIRYLQGAKASSNFGKGGFMGNTLTIAMLVQLRDPLRNNEPVGAPMMALVQAERMIIPPRPKLPRRAPSMLGNSEVWADEDIPVLEEPVQPQFKVSAVHVSGLKASDEHNPDQSTKRKAWGSQKQQQSGSRWLAANGMGKSMTAGSKLSGLKNKPQPSQTTVKPRESLWSISSRVHGTGSKWKDVAGLNSHIRNPDVIFANQKIRTR